MTGDFEDVSAVQTHVPAHLWWGRGVVNMSEHPLYLSELLIAPTRQLGYLSPSPIAHSLEILLSASIVTRQFVLLQREAV